eukprot:3769635-Pyramimonas_sp.AAC.1
MVRRARPATQAISRRPDPLCVLKVGPLDGRPIGRAGLWPTKYSQGQTKRRQAFGPQMVALL